MAILALGINHKTATIAVREKVSFSDDKRLLALQQLTQFALADSAVILSTCNRTEVYFHNRTVSPSQEQDWLNRCISWFANIHQLNANELTDCLYSEYNQDATHHLMCVACGLDSLILGEPQILGQVKQAYQVSEQYYQHTMSSEFSRLFQKTFSAAKRVRSETQIGESAVSVAYAACSLARQIFEKLSNLNILLVGAGETIELVSRHLLRHGVKQLTIANRTLSRAQALVEKLESPQFIDVLPLENLQGALNQADIVITSTGSPNVLIDYGMVKQAQKQRKNKPMLIVDIAVPRDVDENAGKLESVYHYTVDDLQHIIRHNLNQREQASKQAQAIIAQENEDFFEWLKVRQSSDLIRTYRESAEQIRQDLLEKALQSLQQGENASQVLQELSRKLTNKLLHQPTQVIQKMVKSGNSQGLQIFSESINKDVKS